MAFPGHTDLTPPLHQAGFSFFNFVPHIGIHDWQASDCACIDGFVRFYKNEMGTLTDAEITQKFEIATGHHKAGRLQQAAEGYAELLKARSDHVPAALNFGIVLAAANQPVAAIGAFLHALKYAPQNMELHNRLGLALEQHGDKANAAAAYRKAIALDPRDSHGYINLAALLQANGNLKEAEVLFRQAVVVQPNQAAAWYRLGVYLCDTFRITEGFTAFRKYAELMRDVLPQHEDLVAPYRARHDAEQRAWLAGRGVSIDESKIFPIHIEGGERVAGPAICIADAEKAERRWAQGRPQILVLDDFLTPAALQAIRTFCLGSTIWRLNYDDGYLGAMPEHGVTSPLMAQIAEELAQALPGIFGGHPLRYLWGFKYDSRMSGINVHADKAAVNVNFWITPDEANLDSDSGGLLIWDKAAPLDWGPNQFNDNPQMCREFLAKNDSKAIRIPYRANRAVIFDSDLLHETDKLSFRDGYENRRVNMTLLYGARKAGEVF